MGGVPRHFPARECDALAARLASLIGDEPQTTFARRCGFSESTLRNYLDGADPSRSRLVAIADACDVSIEWLATGRGARERRPVAPAAGGAFDDLERLTRAVAAVQEGLQASGRTFAPDRYAQLVAAAYQLMAAPGTTTAQIVQFIKAAT